MAAKSISEVKPSNKRGAHQKGGNLAQLSKELSDSLSRGLLRGGICREKESTETEDGVAEVDDAVAMGDEDHCVIRQLGCEALQQCGFGLGIES